MTHGSIAEGSMGAASFDSEPWALSHEHLTID